jgi:uncharacterized protein (TIGR00645 family)
MDKTLEVMGRMLFSLRFLMSLFYVGLLAVMLAILFKFFKEILSLVSLHTLMDISKMDLIIKVLELVDMTMVAQLVWVVLLAGFSLFVTSGHFEKGTTSNIVKPDWLDHVSTYNLKLKLAFAVISISGVHALKTYLKGAEGADGYTIIAITVLIHFVFVLSAVGISFAEWLTREKKS